MHFLDKQYLFRPILGVGDELSSREETAPLSVGRGSASVGTKHSGFLDPRICSLGRPGAYPAPGLSREATPQAPPDPSRMSPVGVNHIPAEVPSLLVTSQRPLTLFSFYLFIYLIKYVFITNLQRLSCGSPN